MLNFSDFVRIFKLMYSKLETKIKKLTLELVELLIKCLDAEFSKFICFHGLFLLCFFFAYKLALYRQLM